MKRETKIEWFALSLALSLFFGVVRHSAAVDLGGEKLDITLDFTYATQYMWHGYDLYNGHGGFQPSIRADYRGFCLGLWGSWTDHAGFDDQTELDYYAGYGRSLFDEERYQLDLHLLYTYFSFPKIDSRYDLQEVAVGFALPKLIPIGPACLVPRYDVFFDWAGVEGGNRMEGGWFHTLGLSYDLPIPALIPDQKEQSLSFSWDITYNDGALGSNPGWSHITVGVSTQFEWKEVYFIPAVRYQWSLEETVDPEDEFYATFSVGYKF